MINLKRKMDIFSFISFLIFKISVDLGFFYILSKDATTYIRDFNYLKYINGLIWCVIIYHLIRFDRRLVSSFFLLFKILLEIIPITTIYAFSNQNFYYYNILLLSYGLCEILVGWLPEINNYKVIPKLSLIMIFSLSLIAFIMTLHIVNLGGIPSLKAFNIYKVYEIRKMNAITLSKYLSYFFNWMMWVIFPFWIAKTIELRKYLITLVLSSIIISYYLYFGHKTFLFSIPLIIICTVWSRRQKFINEFLIVFSIVHAVLVLFSMKLNICYQIYSLIGRRVMIVSANNKFNYYDFFSHHAKMGIVGIFPQWLVNIKNQYPEGIGHIIANEYYNNPIMNSNTGFFAEGYMRFGILGTIISIIFFSFLLRLMDSYQKKTSYSIAIGTCIYLIFDLSDGHLLDSLFFGPWMILILILIFYTRKNGVNEMKI